MSWTEENVANLEPWAQRTIDNLPTSRRRTVLGFLQCLSDEGAGLATLNCYVAALKTLDGGRAYVKLTEADIRGWTREIDGRLEPNSAWLYKFSIRRFLTWVRTGKLDGEYPPCVSWLKNRNNKRDLGREILTQTEIKQLVEATSKQRDRALVFVLYESGARAGEIANLKIRDFEPDQYGGVLRLRGKTGGRRVRLFESVPDLQLWLSMHPDRNNSESPLWLSERRKGQPIHRRTLRDLVVAYAKKAGLKKKISPHTFRHSRATHLAKPLKEAQLREFFGWTKDSDMPSIYVHLSGRDVDESLFEHYGIKPREEPQDSPLKKKVCDRCKAENSVSARFCWRCWLAFDTAKSEELTAQALEILMGMVDPAQFREKLKERGLDQKITELARGGK